MSSGMNMEEAEKIADKMSYRQAIMNCLYARCVPYRKATKIKMERLLECIEAFNLDLDLYTPMHFTPEQKAWVKKYIAINAERQRVEVLDEVIKLYEEFQPKLATNVYEFGERLKQMQKRGAENEINKKRDGTF